MRHRGMPATAGQGDLEPVSRRHRRAMLNSGLTNIQPRPVMHPPYGFYGELIKQTFVTHDFAAAAIFLSRLKNHNNITVKMAVICQIFCRAKQHGRMPVMAAGMHDSIGF